MCAPLQNKEHLAYLVWMRFRIQDWRLIQGAGIAARYNTLWSWNKRHVTASLGNAILVRTSSLGCGTNGQDSTRHHPHQNVHVLPHYSSWNSRRICNPWRSL